MQHATQLLEIFNDGLPPSMLAEMAEPELRPIIEAIKAEGAENLVLGDIDYLTEQKMELFRQRPGVDPHVLLNIQAIFYNRNAVIRTLLLG